MTVNMNRLCVCAAICIGKIHRYHHHHLHQRFLSPLTRRLSLSLPPSPSPSLPSLPSPFPRDPFNTHQDYDYALAHPEEEWLNRARFYRDKYFNSGYMQVGMSHIFLGVVAIGSVFQAGPPPIHTTRARIRAQLKA